MRIELSLAAAAVLLTTVGAQALPSFPSNPASQADQVIQVRGGCGLGWHRGPYGGCQPNTAARGPRGANACWFVGGRKVCR